MGGGNGVGKVCADVWSRSTVAFGAIEKTPETGGPATSRLCSPDRGARVFADYGKIPERSDPRVNTGDGGRLLAGPRDALKRGIEAFQGIPVDWDGSDAPAEAPPLRETTLKAPIRLRGKGTFLGRAIRTVGLDPAPAGSGWWIDRGDLADCLPTQATIRNVWTTGQIVSNIVLRSGPPQNYIRMVEHLVALKPGLWLDNVRVSLDSGDPPLFDRGSRDLADAVEAAGIVEQDVPARWMTVAEPCCVSGANGAFLALAPPAGGIPGLTLDVAVDFPNAIGRQRVRFALDRPRFREASLARTNTSAFKKLYCQTVGRLFADIRNLGYTRHNILIAGRRRYHNEPRLVHQGKSLEAAWHRAILDLPAALALTDSGRFAGSVVSYRAGHALDVHMMTLLTLHGLLREMPADPDRKNPDTKHIKETPG